MDRIACDKKSRGGRVAWLLFDAAGAGVVDPDVPPEVAAGALSEFLRGRGRRAL